MASKAKSTVKPGVATTGIDHVVLHVSDLPLTPAAFGVLPLSLRERGAPSPLAHFLRSLPLPLRERGLLLWHRGGRRLLPGGIMEKNGPRNLSP